MADEKIIMTTMGQSINIEPVKIKRPRIQKKEVNFIPDNQENAVVSTNFEKEPDEPKQVQKKVKSQQKKKSRKPQQENRQPKMSKEERKEQLVETLKKVITTDGGKFVRFEDKTYLMMGGVEHDNHLYFMVMNCNRDIEFMPMKSTYRIARNVDASMGVVNYLLERQRNDIIDITMEFLNLNEEYNLLTELGVKPFVTRNNNNKKFKKETKKVNKKKQ